MSKLNSYRCDGQGCQQERRETNHWIVAWEEGDRLLLSPWNDDLAKKDGAQHLCGSACCLKEVAAYLGKLTNGKSDTN